MVSRQNTRLTRAVRAKTPSSPCADREDRDQLDQVRDRVRVLVGMRRVGVEEAAAIRAEFLDDLLRCGRALRDDLFRPFESRRLAIGAKVLRHALPY